MKRICKYGTERGVKSKYRDNIFESDFEVGPSDYTYCDLLDGNGDSGYIGVRLDDSVMVIHKRSAMTHQPGYDLGMNYIYQFNDKNNKRQAIHLILRYEKTSRPFFQKLGLFS